MSPLGSREAAGWASGNRSGSPIRREVPNLFLAGDYLRAPSVNGALASGVNAAGDVAGWLLGRKRPSDGG